MTVEAQRTGAGQWLSMTSAALAAVIVGFASTILVVIEGVKAVGANPAQQASCAAVLCFGMAITSLMLGWRFKQPIVIAWSTPGAALLATNQAVITFPEAVGAFVFAAALMVLTAFVKPLSTAIGKMPPAVAAALLAGVLLHYVVGVPAAALDMPEFVLPLVVVFFALRMVAPMFSVPLVVGLGLLFSALSGGVHQAIPIHITPLTIDSPQWNLQVLAGLGIPLYLVTMASQNLPGFAVLKAHGYEPHVQPCLAVTGIGSLIAAPFGGHAINMAAITAAMVAGTDVHPDARQRWKVVFPYFVLYVAVGLAAGSFVAVLGALPKSLVTAMAGLALFSPLMGGLTAMLKEPKDIEPALVTFLVSASGISIFGVGPAFWGLVCGLLLWAVKRVRAA